MTASAAPVRVVLAAEWFLKYTAGVARGLQEQGCEVLLLTRSHDLEFGGEPGAMERYMAANLPDATRHLTLDGRVRDPAALPQLARLRRAVREFRPDVVHLQESVEHDMRLVLAAGARPRRYALTVHDPRPHPGDPIPSARIHHTRVTLRRWAKLLFVHSDALAAEVRRLDRPRAPMVVVPHGVDPPDPQPFPADPGLLFFGRISHYKGLDVLLDAMPAVWSRLPGLRLVVAGDGELPHHPVLADPRVDLRHGHVAEEEMAPLFAAAGCVVLPYREASQSGVATQVRRFGRPLVTTAVGGLPDQVTPQTGRLVPPEDPPALAAALIEVMGTEGLAERMGEAAGRTADEQSYGRVGERTLAAYRAELLGAAATARRRWPRGPARR